ncbi:hypothetical protein LXL04_033102 [Taraxacum kok-saghyz]
MIWKTEVFTNGDESVQKFVEDVGCGVSKDLKPQDKRQELIKWYQSMVGAGKDGGEGSDGTAVKKLEEQLGILQIQTASHGTDIREMNHRIETILNQQEEMRILNEEVGRSLAKLLEKLDGNGEASGTPNSGLVTPTASLLNRGKNIDVTGTAVSNPSGLQFGTTGRNGANGGAQGGNGGGIPGRNGPGPFNGGTGGFNPGGGFVNEGGRGGRYKYRHRKIDMPQFSGSDPDGWILQSERYFAIYQLIEEEKVEATILCLSGDTLSWYHWSRKQHPLTTWEAMKTLFLKKFRPIHGGDLYEQWAAVEQTTYVASWNCRRLWKGFRGEWL